MGGRFTSFFVHAMVYINNGFANNNQVVDWYFRNLEEYRSGVENTFLPVLSYFIFYSENYNGSILLPSKLLEDQREYLKDLWEKYYQRNFSFRVDDQNINPAFDQISKLIRHTKKWFKYSYCDFLDFIIQYPELFQDVKIPYNVAKRALEETKEFNHIATQRLQDIVKFSSKNTFQAPINDIQKNTTVPTYKKYLTPFQLYMFVLSNVKRALDFEILKLYDYLAECPRKNIFSNKLLEIESELIEAGQWEYTKFAYTTKVCACQVDQRISDHDIWIDQWSANIRRVIDTQKLITSDLIEYLRHPSNKANIPFIRSGCYPEIVSLLNRFFNNTVPKDLF